MRKIIPALAVTAALGGAAAAYAANGGGGWFAAESENIRTARDGYSFSVHPAFSTGAQLRDAGGRVTKLYRQDGVVNLPAGRTQPPAQHTIRLAGGELGRDLGITVNDPKHQVARITVELYGADHQAGRKSAVTQTLVVENGVVLCPPMCPTGGGSGGQ